MNNKTWRHPSIAEGELKETPLYYKSMPGTPAIQRLRSMNMKSSTPYIAEYLSGTLLSTTYRVDFDNTYDKKPLVIGLLRRTNGKTTKLEPNGEIMTVERTHVTIGSPFGTLVNIGDRFELRVYNLKI